jgi:PAS domain S-box-containing protein
MATKRINGEVIQSLNPFAATDEIERLKDEPEPIRERTTKAPLIWKYGMAVLSVAAALLATLWMRQELGQPSTPIVGLFLCAAMLSAWFGGIGPGLLAVGLSFLAVVYYFATPLYSFAVDIWEVPRLIVFVLSALFVGALSSAQRRKTQNLTEAHETLRETVQQLEVTNRALRRENAERKQAEAELRRQKEILQQIFDHIPLLINFVEANGRIRLVNREWERALGWSLEEIRQQNVDVFAECYPDPDYHRKVLEFVTEAKGEWADFKVRVRDGRMRDMSFVRILLSDGTSIGIGNDITARKQDEEARRDAEQKYRGIFDNALEGIFQTSPDGRFVVANPALARMFGFDSAEELIRERSDISKQHYVEPLRREKFKRLMETEGVVHEFEYEAYRKDGSRIWVSDNVRAVRDTGGNLVCYEGIAVDITKRKQAEEKIRASSEQLRALSASLQSAREEEAMRIAREIHDELGSVLTSLKLDLELIRIEKNSEITQLDPSESQKKIRTMMQLIDQTIGVVQRISSELRPSVLDNIGLVAALRWQGQQLEERSGIVCDYDFKLEDVDLDPERSTAIFRVFQEALTNVVRHAQASRIDITLKKEADDLVLTISDNGRGITAGEKSARQSLGLLGMQERMNLIGGSIYVTGLEGKGTVIAVRVPMPGID